MEITKSTYGVSYCSCPCGHKMLLQFIGWTVKDFNNKMSNINILKKSSKLYARLLNTLKNVNGMIHRNMGRPMVNILLKVSTLGGYKLNQSLVKIIIVYLRFCHNLIKTGGPRLLVIYLKACFVLTQQSIGGHKARDSFPLGCGVARSRGGLPRLIPSLHRERIRNGDKSVIKL
jgi:hypothetical protein